MYQYMMYTLAMWNSYLFVSALDIFVVVLAGLISIFSARRSQKAIEQASKKTCLKQMPALLHVLTRHFATNLLDFEQYVFLSPLCAEPGSVWP